MVAMLRSPKAMSSCDCPSRTRIEAPRPRRHRAWLRSIAAGAALFCAGLDASGSDTQTQRSGLAEVRTLDQEGRLDQAVRRYRELLRRYPESTEVRLRLANDLARTAKCEDSSEPENLETGPAGAAQETVVGICHFRRNEMPTALADLTKALELAPRDKQAAIFLGRAYAESGKPQEGVGVLQALGEGGKNDPDVLYWMGVFYDQLAQQTYEAMAKSHPDSSPLLETQGDQLLQQQKYDEALKAYQKALSGAADEPGLHFDVGNTDR